MAMDYKSGFCELCNTTRKVERKGTNHILHLLITLVTFGFWLIIWILVSVKIGGWRCEQCGTTKVSRIR